MRRTLLAIFAVSAAALMGCSSGEADSGDSEGTTTLDSAVVACAALDPLAYPVGTATKITADQLETSQCTPVDGEDVSLGGALSIVVSGRDRDTMTLEGVNDKNTIIIDVEYPGPGCATTMEWRGDMSLLISDVPEGATVELNNIPTDCEN